MDLTAFVPRDVADLIPGFLRNRQEEIGHLEEALASEDLATLVHLGERMYALGNPYGFRQITTFGRQLRDACAAQNLEPVGDLPGQYREYLSKVTIVQVDVPVIRSQWRDRADARVLTISNGKSA
jgi:hypothetical protein